MKPQKCKFSQCESEKKFSGNFLSNFGTPCLAFSYQNLEKKEKFLHFHEKAKPQKEFSQYESESEIHSYCVVTVILFDSTYYVISIFLSFLVEDDELYANQTLAPGDDDETIGAKEDFIGKTSATSAENETGYGFGWTRSGVFGRFGAEIAGLLDIADPEDTPIRLRADLLRQFDANHFQPEHYLLVLCCCLHTFIFLCSSPTFKL